MIRPYTEKDFPAVQNIYSQSKLDELIFEDKEFELLPLEKDERRFTEFNEAEKYVLENGKIVGYGALKGSVITALYVLPKMRGKGCGRKLLEFLLARIAGPVDLYVAKTNIHAKSLYEQYGFKVTEEFETDYNGVKVMANKMTSNIRL